MEQKRSNQTGIQNKVQNIAPKRNAQVGTFVNHATNHPVVSAILKENRLVSILTKKIADIQTAVLSTQFFQKASINEFCVKIEIAKNIEVNVTFVRANGSFSKIVWFEFEGVIVAATSKNAENVAHEIISYVSAEIIRGCVVGVLCENQELQGVTAEIVDLPNPKLVVKLCDGWLLEYRSSEKLKSYKSSRKFCISHEELDSFVSLKRDAIKHFSSVVSGVLTEIHAKSLFDIIIAKGMFKSVEKTSPHEDRTMERDYYLITNLDTKFVLQIKTAPKCSCEVKTTNDGTRALYVYMNKSTKIEEFYPLFCKAFFEL